MTDCQYPRDYTDRQLMESIWRRIDGLSMMLSGPISAALQKPPKPGGCRCDDS
jgi:hypothetical protein